MSDTEILFPYTEPPLLIRGVLWMADIAVDGSPQAKKARALNKAADALKEFARNAHVVSGYPEKYMRPTLLMLSERRPYCFEKNTRRWLKGEWHLLGRNYQPWRGHEIILSRADLDALGLMRWRDSKLVSCGFMDPIFPIADDLLWHRPTRWKLANLAGLMQVIAERFRARLKERDAERGAA